MALRQRGDAWGGGGLLGENEILLNHPAESLIPADGSQIPQDVKVALLPNAGRGEDDPTFRAKMSRDGWTLVQEGEWIQHESNSGIWWTADPAETWHKPHPDRQRTCALQMRTHGIHERQGSWYVTSYELIDRTGRVIRDLGRADWADWDASGDLLVAAAGKVSRTSIGSGSKFDLYATARDLIDLSGLTFEPREPVLEAKQWAGPPPRGVQIATAT